MVERRNVHTHTLVSLIAALAFSIRLCLHGDVVNFDAATPVSLNDRELHAAVLYLIYLIYGLIE